MLGNYQQALKHLTHQDTDIHTKHVFVRQAHLMCLQVVLQTWQSLIAAAQEAEGSDPVVNSDDDDSAPVRHLLAVIQGVSQDCQVVGRSQQEGPSKQVNHHRKVGGHCWRSETQSVTRVEGFCPGVRSLECHVSVLTLTTTKNII